MFTEETTQKLIKAWKDALKAIKEPNGIFKDYSYIEKTTMYLLNIPNKPSLRLNVYRRTWNTRFCITIPGRKDYRFGLSAAEYSELVILTEQRIVEIKHSSCENLVEQLINHNPPKQSKQRNIHNQLPENDIIKV